MSELMKDPAGSRGSGCGVGDGQEELSNKCPHAASQTSLPSAAQLLSPCVIIDAASSKEAALVKVE